MSRARIALVTAVVLDAALWSVPFAGVGHWSDLQAAADFNAAAAGAIIVVILILSPRLRDRSDKRFQSALRQMAESYARREAALIKSFAYALAQAPKNPTGPFPALRPVPGGRR